jgi:hypothetical protein
MESKSHEHVVHVNREKKRSLLRDKPWVVSTVVLALLVVLLLLANVFNFTGKTISAEKAGQNLLDFATAQGLEAEVSSVERDGNFYLVTLLIQDEEVPVYVTKDGKYFTSSLIPLEEEEEVNNTDTNTNTQTQEIPKSEKPTVELFVMSHCPYGTQAEKGIIPAIELLDDKVDFNLRFVYYAMHPSAGEVEEQIRQYCIQKEQESKLFPYLKCFLGKTGTSADAESCLTEIKIDKTKLNLCVSKTDKDFVISENKNDKTKWLSGNYPLFNIDKELNTLYKIGGSPTLVINGVQVNSARDPASYLDSICQAFSDGNVPEECGEQLSTTAYSPGFGYTAGTTTNAQC